MPLFARQVEALLAHLELESAVVGGTSLGANVTLELAVRRPSRVQALFIEMPVLDNALAAVAGIFAPVMLALRFGRPLFEVVSFAASRVPRSHYLVDIGLDWLRQRPGPSVAVLEGLLLGESAPHSEERRRLTQPALIIGHPADPLHPFSDSDMLAEELPKAKLVEAESILEWRLSPGRLNDELALFVEQVWEEEEAGDRPSAMRVAGQGG
jgi:pimeloyl-ACP methyl ester carboxylesterase